MGYVYGSHIRDSLSFSWMWCFKLFNIRNRIYV